MPDKLIGRIGVLAIGLSTNQLITYAGDYVLYPAVIWKLGILKGGVVMLFVSFFVCILLIKVYDWSKQDWLGIEAIKGLKGYEGNNLIARATAWMMKKSDPFIVVFLSIKSDPFIVTVYLRHGKYNGMSKRDWIIFTSSLVIANAYWTLACYMGISLFEWVWGRFVGIF
jgi:hypothetical protein